MVVRGSQRIESDEAVPLRREPSLLDDATDDESIRLITPKNNCWTDAGDAVATTRTSPIVALPHERNRLKPWERKFISQRGVDGFPSLGIILRRRGLEATIVDWVTSAETVGENKVRLLIRSDRRSGELPVMLVKRGAPSFMGRQRRWGMIDQQAKNDPHIKMNERDKTTLAYVRLSAGWRTSEKDQDATWA